MMMEAINGEQATFRRMDEILESVTHALELPLPQAERVVAGLVDNGANWRGWSHKSYVYSTMLERCASEWTRDACPSCCKHLKQSKMLNPKLRQHCQDRLTILRHLCTENSSEMTNSDARFPQILGDTPQVNTHSKDLDELKLSERCFK